MVVESLSKEQTPQTCNRHVSDTKGLAVTPSDREVPGEFGTENEHPRLSLRGWGESRVGAEGGGRHQRKVARPGRGRERAGSLCFGASLMP